MTHIIDIHSYKGGTGVTTTACATALAFARQGRKTLLVDAQDKPTTYAWLSLPEPSQGNTFTTVTFDNGESQFALVTDDESGPVNFDDYEVVVYDNGRETNIPYGEMGYPVSRVCVVRNDYLTLRNTVTYRGAGTPEVPSEDAFVLFIHKEGALSERDVQAVLSNEVISTSIDPQAQRAIDAGLASTRRLFDWAEELTRLVPEGVK